MIPSDIFFNVFYFSFISQISCRDLNFFCSVSLEFELLLVLISVARLVDKEGSCCVEFRVVLLVLNDVSGDRLSVSTMNLLNLVGVLFAATLAGE